MEYWNKTYFIGSGVSGDISDDLAKELTLADVLLIAKSNAIQVELLKTCLNNLTEQQFEIIYILKSIAE